MSVTVDRNVLVYASNRAEPVHARALELVGRLAAGPELVVLFWPTLLGYLRLVTHPSILPRPLAPRAAAANVAALLERPHIRPVGEGDGFWALFERAGGAAARADDVPDVHLAALMRQHGVRRIYTRDRGLRRFDGIEPLDPFA